jgi:hypothetical protein
MEIQFTVPTSWKKVSLKKYLELNADLLAYEDNEIAKIAVLFHHLTTFPVEYLKDLDVDTFTQIKNDIMGFFNDTEHELQRIIEIDGVKYGFEPNLSKLSYGAYVDISKYEDIQIDKNWSDIMSILYRPIKTIRGARYEIQPYKGGIDGEKFLNVGMDVHFGAVFFFNRLSVDLLKDTLRSLKEEGTLHNIKSILEKNGNLTPQFTNLPEEIFSDLIK